MQIDLGFVHIKHIQLHFTSHFKDGSNLTCRENILKKNFISRLADTGTGGVLFSLFPHIMHILLINTRMCALNFSNQKPGYKSIYEERELPYQKTKDFTLKRICFTFNENRINPLVRRFHRTRYPRSFHHPLQIREINRHRVLEADFASKLLSDLH